MNKCHWCGKEFNDEHDSYCSDRCSVEHDCRFEWWWKQFGLEFEETSINWMIDNIEFSKYGYTITSLKEKLIRSKNG